MIVDYDATSLSQFPQFNHYFKQRLECVKKTKNNCAYEPGTYTAGVDKFSSGTSVLGVTACLNSPINSDLP